MSHDYILAEIQKVEAEITAYALEHGYSRYSKTIWDPVYDRMRKNADRLYQLKAGIPDQQQPQPINSSVSIVDDDDDDYGK